MFAEKNETFVSDADFFPYTNNMTREYCQKRKAAIVYENYLKECIAEKDKQLADMDNQLAEKDKQLADMDRKLAELEAKIAKYGKADN